MRALRIGAAQLVFRRSIGGNVRLISDFISEAAARRCDAVLFPECALTGYNVDFREIKRSEIEDGLAAIAEAARRERIHVMVGSPTFMGSHRFNSLVVFDRKGKEIFRYDKIHLTERDQDYFKRGNKIAWFEIDRVRCTAIICHERRYPELVRLPVMMGAQILFHPNAGLDTLEVSKSKRRGRDGIATRAFENEIFYVFANSVGPQGNDRWSAGDSKIVAPNGKVLAMADNRRETLIDAQVDLSSAGRKYAQDALRHPAFLRSHWKAMLAACRASLGSRNTTKVSPRALAKEENDATL